MSSNDGEHEAVSIQEFRPALRTGDFFRTLFELAERGKLDERRMPDLTARNRPTSPHACP